MRFSQVISNKVVYQAYLVSHFLIIITSVTCLSDQAKDRACQQVLCGYQFISYNMCRLLPYFKKCLVGLILKGKAIFTFSE